MSNEYKDWLADRKENLELADRRGDRFCSDMCKMMYIEKLSLDEFWHELSSHWEDYKKNMICLHGEDFKEYPEMSIKRFANWLDMD